MDVIALILAFFAFATAAACGSKIKVLEKRIALIKGYVNFSDIDMLSSETKRLIGQADKEVVIKAIRKELEISQKDAEILIENIQSENRR